MSNLDEFMEMLCGAFDNRAQILREMASGNLIHPKARHIIGMCNDMILNLPKDFRGCFVIEESYFQVSDRKIEKHYLFLYEEDAEGNIILTSYNIPEEIPKETFTNDNSSLRLDFRNLVVSPRFKPLLLREKNGTYFGENTSQFSEDSTFEFSLTVTSDILLVKELLMKGNERVAGYDTPTEYIKCGTVKREDQ
jgi:hypothetical protein